MTGDNEEIWQRWDAVANGDALPPDGELRGPATDPAPGCPVIALGMSDGMTHWLDFRGEYRALTPRQLGVRAEFMALVGGGNTEWLWTCWPRFATRKIDGELRVAIVGWVLTGAVDWLLKLAGEQPIWGPHVITRRPGVWPGETGAPIVHCGNVIWIDGDLQPAGMRTGNLIWPACPAEARPGAPCGPEIGKGIQMRMQELWTFRQGGGAIVALGTIGSALLGAWPRWRASMFIAGVIGAKPRAVVTLADRGSG